MPSYNIENSFLNPLAQGREMYILNHMENAEAIPMAAPLSNLTMPSREFLEKQTLVNFLARCFPGTLAIRGFEWTAANIEPHFELYREQIRAEYRALLAPYQNDNVVRGTFDPISGSRL